MRKLSAWEELSLNEKAHQLLPTLLQKGLELSDALALGHNASRLYFVQKDRWASPREVLETLSLGEIADLCEQTAEEESAFNVNFKEESS